MASVSEGTQGPFSWVEVKEEVVEEEPAGVSNGASLPEGVNGDALVVATKAASGVKNVDPGSDMFLYADVRGVSLVLGSTLLVYQVLKYNMIASWAVDGDLFKAVALKNQLWSFVNLYLHHPAAVQHLQETMPVLVEGQPAPGSLMAACPAFGDGMFMNPRLAGVNPIEELKQIMASTEAGKLAEQIAAAVVKNGPEYARVVGEKLASAVMEVRAARDALQAVLRERDGLKLQLEEARLAAPAVVSAAGYSDENAARISKLWERDKQQWEADKQHMLNHMAELESEVNAWRASNAQSRGIGDRYAELAEAHSRLEVDNTKLMALLEESQTTLEGQIKTCQEAEAKLREETSARQAAEALAEAASQRAQVAAAAAQLNKARDIHGPLMQIQSTCRTLAEENRAVRAEAEALKTAIPLMGAYFDRHLREFMASGGFLSLQDAVARYRKECRLRKQLYNQLMELRGNIRVYCRVRPPTDREQTLHSETVVRTQPSEPDTLWVVSDLSTKQFEFDRVFTSAASQEDVFADTRPLVQSVVDGYNVCIFAYGQTGSGKTYTMEGPQENPGVNSRALAELFNLAAERRDEADISITVSILEIYNETIRDLLVPASAEAGKLEVKQHPQGGVHVPGLAHQAVADVTDVESLLRTARNNRTTFATNMNDHSSRSHSLLSVNVLSTNRLTRTTHRGKLHLVDLAGSERVSKSEVEGERLREAQNINRSLSALGDVINALATKSQHVPYRNSKLTYALQDSLGGDSKVLMFVQVSPAADNVTESLSSLNFATRVRGVELGAAKVHTEREESLSDTSIPGSPGGSKPCSRSPSLTKTSSPAAAGMARRTSSMSGSSTTSSRTAAR